jgi:AcrR family transcriptional regulator
MHTQPNGPNFVSAPDGRPRGRVDDVRDIALTLFAERGYHGTTMSQIADALGVRVPTLYSHIRSKQDLLAEIAVETTGAVLADFQRAIAGIDDVSERLRRAIEAYALRHATHRRQALVVNRDTFSLEEPTRSAVLTSRQQHEHAVRQLISDGLEAGVFHVKSPSIASFAILEMSVSIARWFHEDGPLSADEVARQHSEFALSIAKSRA